VHGGKKVKWRKAIKHLIFDSFAAEGDERFEGREVGRIRGERCGEG
jgi:hypothetical protein